MGLVKWQSILLPYMSPLSKSYILIKWKYTRQPMLQGADESLASIGPLRLSPDLSVVILWMCSLAHHSISSSHYSIVPLQSFFSTSDCITIFAERCYYYFAFVTVIIVVPIYHYNTYCLHDELHANKEFHCPLVYVKQNQSNQTQYMMCGLWDLLVVLIWTRTQRTMNGQGAALLLSHDICSWCKSKETQMRWLTMEAEINVGKYFIY